MINENLKWYQKKNGIIILLILFFPVGLYLMWKHSDWNKQTKIIITLLFVIGIFIGKTNKSSDTSSDSNINDSSMTDSSIYGTYSDFSGWSSTITGKVIVSENSWMSYINDNGSTVTQKGVTKETILYDEGGNEYGYISGDKVYIWYLNGKYPVGK